MKQQQRNAVVETKCRTILLFSFASVNCNGRDWDCCSTRFANAEVNEFCAGAARRNADTRRRVVLKRMQMTGATTRNVYHTASQAVRCTTFSASVYEMLLARCRNEWHEHCTPFVARGKTSRCPSTLRTPAISACRTAVRHARLQPKCPQARPSGASSVKHASRTRLGSWQRRRSGSRFKIFRQTPRKNGRFT